MSTIAVVKKNGYAAIAADTLTKCGENKDSAEYVANHNKILALGEGCYVAIAGPVSAKLAMADYFSNLPEPPKLNNVAHIYRTWLKLHKALKEEYFLQLHEDPEDYFESSHMDAVIVNPSGIFGVSIHRDVQEFSKFYAYGGGAVFALGAMHALYSMPQKSAHEIACAGVQAASDFDDSTGLPVVSFEIKLRERED